uniref:(northern house mosquito) hypothetical protein n=1 Tax=Culex pipiens TaxID=7175 RepID=A0A8D8CHG1_CULPI
MAHVPKRLQLINLLREPQTPLVVHPVALLPLPIRPHPLLSPLRLFVSALPSFIFTSDLLHHRRRHSHHLTQHLKQRIHNQVVVGAQLAGGESRSTTRVNVAQPFVLELGLVARDVELGSDRVPGGVPGVGF